MLQDAFKRCLQRKRFPLSERQVEILKLHYGIGCQEMSLGEIAGELKITRERVRQLHENALRSLQKSGEFDCLKEYL
jgi:RNA polymerase primary sigma factor